MKIKNINYSISNSKLNGIISVSLPAGITCNRECDCFKYGDCYALKNRFKFKNVYTPLEENLKAFLSNSGAYFEDIKDFLNNGLTVYRYFRWNVSGDLVDAEYFKGVCDVAKCVPFTKFLIFTKKYDIVNDFIKNGGFIPKNLRVIFSAWNKNWNVENPYNLPVAYVNFKDKTQNPDIPATAIQCTGKCSGCLGCWSLGIGGSTVFNQH